MIQHPIPHGTAGRPAFWGILVGSCAVVIAGCAWPGVSTLENSRESASVEPTRSAPQPASTRPAATVEQPDSSTPSCVRPLASPAPPVAELADVCPEDPEPGGRLPTVEVTFVDAPGRPRVIAEHAQTPQQKTRGLMYRTELAQDSRMLFSWPTAAPRSFWMENTCLPLDMLFIDANGVIVSALEQVPTLNRLPRSSGCPASRVLEVNAGWMRAHAVEPGQRVEIRE